MAAVAGRSTGSLEGLENVIDVRDANQKAARLLDRLESGHSKQGRWFDAFFVVVLVGGAVVGVEVLIEQFGWSLGPAAFVIVAVCVAAGWGLMFLGAFKSFQSLFGRAKGGDTK